ncbi:Lar family restriction alleviation protein [Thalassotalea sp. G20_0]|uniref:Lar family restriction alleviation protein n=1 Tax=Thalassotalea sp. G20_0 TaxID=2821093 RepID=UPI001AD9C3E4|nr:Lar family restriction alleviation protein [Thalassotalea sp. G20_0]MBO9493817.1 Lar family restriction alleviation protein [Thalassotalea sp. G20_0]
MGIELKDCPFCGSKAQLIECSRQDPLGRARIDCSVCRGGFDYLADKDQLAKMWNSRVPTKRAAPCENYCEQAAFNIEIRRLKSLLGKAWDAIQEAGYEDHCFELRKAIEEGI